MEPATEEDGAGLNRRIDWGGIGDGTVVVDPGGDDDGDPRKRFNSPDPNGPPSDRTLLRYALRSNTFTGNFGGSAITRLGFNNGAVRARRSNGTWVGGVNIVNAQLSGTLSNGTSATIKFFDADQDTTNTNLWTYDVRYLKNGSWVPICGNSSPGVPRRAYAMPNGYDFGFIVPDSGDVMVTGTGNLVVDANLITFACRGFAYAKCEEFYPPWLSTGGTSLSNTHWACVRALRADTCGDGIAHTEDGVLVNVYDSLGYVEDGEAWPLEARWDTTGALCLDRPSAREDASTTGCVGRNIPMCNGEVGLITTEYSELPTNEANTGNFENGFYGG